MCFGDKNSLTMLIGFFLLLLLLYFSCGIYSNSIKIIEVNFKDIFGLLKLERHKDNWQWVSDFSERKMISQSAVMKQFLTTWSKGR